LIGYLEGKVKHRQNERIMILANSVGYEVLLPVVVAAGMEDVAPGHEISLFIYYHQTEKQPKPVLIGFKTLEEREFFERFLSVEAIGPIKAVSVLSVPINEIASAIENKDAAFLKKLKGVGARTADKIIATLRGKVADFVTTDSLSSQIAQTKADFHFLVLDVLVNQLGYKSAEATELVAKALENNPEISSPEELFDEIYRGQP